MQPDPLDNVLAFRVGAEARYLSLWRGPGRQPQCGTACAPCHASRLLDRV